MLHLSEIRRLQRLELPGYSRCRKTLFGGLSTGFLSWCLVPPDGQGTRAKRPFGRLIPESETRIRAGSPTNPAGDAALGALLGRLKELLNQKAIKPLLSARWTNGSVFVTSHCPPETRFLFRPEETVGARPLRDKPAITG